MVVLLSGGWKQEHFYSGVPCKVLIAYAAWVVSEQESCECSAWKSSCGCHCSGMFCLRKALNHEESEIHNETYLSLSVINFQSFTQYIKVKADMISGLFFFLCWEDSAKGEQVNTFYKLL